jgi:hypothetical protein
MANTLWGAYSVVENRGRKGIEALPALKGRDAEGFTVLTTGGASGIIQRSGADWSAPDDGFVELRSDTAVWLHFALAPVAVVSTDFFMPANETRIYSVMAGDKIAAINA